MNHVIPIFITDNGNGTYSVAVNKHTVTSSYNGNLLWGLAGHHLCRLIDDLVDAAEKKYGTILHHNSIPDINQMVSEDFYNG